jgi:hypothetical protein
MVQDKEMLYHHWEGQDVGDLGEIEWGWGVLTGSVWLKIGQVESSCESNNEPSSSIKC